MVPPIEAGSPTTVLYRVGTMPAPAELPPMEVLERPARHRFDDPKRRFRTLYTAENRRGAYLEKLAWMRPDLTTIAQEQAMEGAPTERPPDVLPASLMASLGVATLRVERVPKQRFLDFRHAATWGRLREELAGQLAVLGLADLDASHVLSAKRDFTQAVAGWAFEQGFNGVVYQSRYDLRVTNWALFEPLHTRVLIADPLDPLDPELLEALDLLKLRLP